MTLQQLRYAIGISKVGSFNKAAESLFISQPSLTTAIHDLEDEIGGEIVDGRGAVAGNQTQGGADNRKGSDDTHIGSICRFVLFSVG